ncbi:MAG: hypothetical protein GX559_00185 [Candidatus Pacebacteria bacterium]|nr:hypothetical protein [Candidatus Paceibacterota bacterium]
MGRKTIQFSKNKPQKNSLVLLLIIIFLINFACKIFKINSIPPGATYDEMVYVAEAQIILKYGTDVSGEWRPWQLLPSKTLYSELTSSTLIPGFLIFPNNLVLASKFVPVIMGSAIPLLLALIVYYFFRKKSFLLCTALVASLNPWIFQFSRMGFDSLFSSFFYLLGIVFLLYFAQWKKLLALIPLFLGFFQYQGHKIIIIPLLALLYFSFLLKDWTALKKKQFKKVFLKNLPVLIILVFFIFLSINYVMRLSSSLAAERMSEITFINQDELSDSVIEQRRLAFASPLNKIFTNKLTVYVSTIFRKLLKSFDPYILFLRGDLSVDTFALNDYGFFHPLDLMLFALFLLLITQAFVNYKDLLLFFLSFILLGTLPTLLKSDNVWITFRNAFAFFGLVMVAGIGLALLIEQFKSKKMRYLIIAIYIIMSSPFFYKYFISYPIRQTAHKGFYYRVLANYIDRQAEQKFILVTDLSSATYDYLLTYNQLLKTETRSALINSAQQRPRLLDGDRIKIYDSCPEDLDNLLDENTTLVIDWLKEPCQPNKQTLAKTRIVSLIDNGTHFSLYGDNLCANFSLQPFINLKTNYLAVEKLEDEIFCSSFFIK